MSVKEEMMKLGEIKIEALKLMYTNGTHDISVEDISELEQNEDYSDYLINMTGSLNRCFSDLENKRVLPVKRYTLPETSEKCGFLRYELDKLIPDLSDIERVVYSNAYGEYEPKADYHTEGGVLVLRGIDFEDEMYSVLYRPRLERVQSYTENDTELDIPENIAVFIPYFIKGDLYVGDEPSEAEDAGLKYESAMAALRETYSHHTGSVISTYDMEVY